MHRAEECRALLFFFGGLRECTLTTGLEKLKNYSGRPLCREVEEIIPSADLVDFYCRALLFFLKETGRGRLLPLPLPLP